MPTYEYACEACENEWEVEQRITEPALTDCPKCGAPKARRLISGSRFVLKGSGWYADGYGSKPAAKSSSDGKAETKSDGKSGEAKSGDAKPSESKSESKPSESKSDSGSSSKSTPASSS
jgi:putative FmdB family regulatory protein